MPVTRCPVCNGPAGEYRFGACSIGCDQVTGDDSSFGDAVALALMLLAAVLIVALIVLG